MFFLHCTRIFRQRKDRTNYLPTGRGATNWQTCGFLSEKNGIFAARYHRRR
jgi:hypothetical protein